MKADEHVRALMDEVCPHNKMGMMFECSRCVQDAFVVAMRDAREEGRAAGYAEAIEKCVEAFDGFTYTTGLSVDQNIAFMNTLRALAPADKEKP